MKIISIIGKEGFGKTKTLNMLYERIFDQRNIIQERKQEGSDKEDFSCVLCYNDKKVALYSMGDYVVYLKKAFKNYSEFGCDCLICAIRTEVMKKKTFTAPNGMIPLALKIEKSNEEQQSVVNEVLKILNE